MKLEEWVAAVLDTADDARLSRGEKRALKDVLRQARFTDADRAEARRRIVRSVAAQIGDPSDRALVEWMAKALGLLDDPGAERTPASRAWFGPKAPMAQTLVSLIDGARTLIEAAVFTITDNRVSDALVRAHRRSVRVRILSDDHKAHDRGSDIFRMQDAGLDVREDRSRAHFHHKFAVFDGDRLLNGSYNWTRGAANDNQENFMLTWEPRLVRAYSMAFEQMWAELDPAT